jgi:hypothetical protein
LAALSGGKGSKGKKNQKQSKSKSKPPSKSKAPTKTSSKPGNYEHGVDPHTITDVVNNQEAPFSHQTFIFQHLQVKSIDLPLHY